MTTTSLMSVQQDALSLISGLQTTQNATQAVTAQWYMTLKLGLTTSQVALESIRNQVQETNSELAAVQYAQSELEIQASSGVSKDAAISTVISAPSFTNSQSYWNSTVNLGDLITALESLDEISQLTPPLDTSTTTLLQLAAQEASYSNSGGTRVLNLTAGDKIYDSLSALFSFGGASSTFSSAAAAMTTYDASVTAKPSNDAVMADGAFVSNVQVLADKLSDILGVNLSAESSIDDIKNAIVDKANALFLEHTELSSELGGQIASYLGSYMSAPKVTEDDLVNNKNALDVLFSARFDDMLSTLFEPLGITIKPTDSLETVTSRLEASATAKSNVSTTQTMDLKIASQNYSNNLSLLVKMMSDRLDDLQNLLRDW